jgi:anti-sigma B factor antagonist
MPDDDRVSRDRRTDLRVESRSEGSLGLLRLHGEVRAELVARLHEAAEGLREQGVTSLLVEMSGVGFIDSASMGEFLRLDADMRGAGGSLVLHSLPRIAQRVLDVTGLLAQLRVAPDEAAARALLR